MNYYSHHIGDYLTATAHLTLLEHGAYRRLIDVYMGTEKPLPLDRKAIYRLVMARHKEEIAAVDSVLNEFFTEAPDGYHQSRCDYEICLCGKNRDNGKKGGRPSKNTNPDETQTKPRNNPEETQTKPRNNPEETQTKPNPKAPITQYPIPNKRTPIAPLPGACDPKTLLTELGVPDAIAADWLAMRKSKRALPTDTAIKGIAREAEKAGWPLADALAVACQRGWTGFKADWTKGDKPPSGAGSTLLSADDKSYRDPMIYGFDVANGDPLPDGWTLPPTGETRFMPGFGWVASPPKRTDRTMDSPAANVAQLRLAAAEQPAAAGGSA